MTVMMRPVLRFFMPFVGVVGITAITFLPLCNLLFSCGCSAMGAANCNIHRAGGAQCPLCAHGNGVFALMYAAILIGVIAAILGMLNVTPKMLPALAAGVVAYGVVASIAGLGIAIYFHYPTWFGVHL